MSRKYEGLVVIDTRGHEAKVDDLVSAIGKEMEEEGAKLDEVKQDGHRQLAYPQKHIQSGHYVNYYFDAEPEVINKIEDRLKLNNQVYIQQYTRLS